MSMEELKQEAQKHIEAAYKLLPSTVEPAYSYRKREDLKEKYELGDWRQLFYQLKAHSRTNDFSRELLRHLELVEDIYETYDRLGMRIALEQLTEEEKRIIGECLHAAAHGPFFLDDWEFPIVFGATHEEAVEVAAAWPNVEETDMTAKAVVNNAINNLFGYPHGKHDQWSKFISVPPQRVDEVFKKFRALTGMANANEKARGAEYFQNMS